jgi:hypothetical protein
MRDADFSCTGKTHMALRITICVLLAGLWSNSVAAQTASSVLRAFGIIGRWTTGDTVCHASSVENDVETYTELPSGDVEERLEFGPGRRPNVSVIHKASRMDAGRVLITARLNNNKDQERVFLMQDGKLRTMSNADEDGTYLVRDGIIVPNGKPTLWRRRCQKDVTANRGD